ncbi:uncharacterized protein BDR25DRAFT_350092 [Lindgomyces ingoldianus]|uniref:Uncharacterized protein n=1 Tax=Lindgomyces ingoldianus TaxID=673940 RepID=A0ACB6R9I8_9PLEO|nr:uncharacterized protein BDR25DRAFT_350092 [Lindgomyces ingoldianus]KAF2475811.1 hypothetical protein BDR25DRAFT_350092 [Lindgomyces ingoldianus]
MVSIAVGLQLVLREAQISFVRSRAIAAFESFDPDDKPKQRAETGEREKTIEGEKCASPRGKVKRYPEDSAHFESFNIGSQCGNLARGYWCKEVCKEAAYKKYIILDEQSIYRNSLVAFGAIHLRFPVVNFIVRLQARASCARLTGELTGLRLSENLELQPKRRINDFEEETEGHLGG